MLTSVMLTGKWRGDPSVETFRPRIGASRSVRRPSHRTTKPRCPVNGIPVFGGPGLGVETEKVTFTTARRVSLSETQSRKEWTFSPIVVRVDRLETLLISSDWSTSTAVVVRTGYRVRVQYDSRTTMYFRRSLGNPYVKPPGKTGAREIRRTKGTDVPPGLSPEYGRCLSLQVYR